MTSSNLCVTAVSYTHLDVYKRQAKRMELGAVVGAAPKENVVREKPEAGDVIILLGGKTGRDLSLIHISYPVGQCTWGAKSLASWVGNYWGCLLYTSGAVSEQ